MATTKDAAMQGVSGPSRGARPVGTVRLDWLMEATQRLEMAQRIVSLRERSPFTQPKMAARLGIGLRAYQKLELKGTTKYERCEELVEIHKDWAEGDPEWGHLSADWIWDGRRRDETPDLVGALNGESQLDRIEAKLDRLLNGGPG